MIDENFSPELAPNIAHARSLPMPYVAEFQNLAQLLRYHVAIRPEADFLRFRDDLNPTKAWSYQEVSLVASQVVGWLRERFGLQIGDRIATLTGNSPETVFLYLGAWLAGVTVVPVNITEDDERIAYILEHAQVKVAFAFPEQAERVKNCQVVSEFDYQGCEHGESDFSFPGNTEALIVYTSGTTGAPKGVVLEHQNLIADAQGIAAWHGFTEADRAMLVLPIHHVNGIIVTLITPLLSGGSVVLNKKFSASRFWKTVEQEKCTWCSVVPTILAFLCETHPEGLPIPPDFRHFICGAGPLTTDLAKRFESVFGARVVHGYGLSETTCYSCFLPINLAKADYAHWMWECGFPSIGIPLPENEMAIHDENGKALPADTRGEIVIRGVNVMRAYFKRPDANEAAFTHGWFRSGDEGFWRSGTDGRPYFFITGRLKELFIRGGVNYSPLEIDEVLNAIPGVKAAMAVGFENNFYGEEIGAYVQLEPGAARTEAEILAACRESLPFNKAPKVVLFGEDFPVTSTGKYQRGKLKERFAKWRDAEFRK
ncbi:class I adenylate-forming enzyme family protein [Armatimonas sp.]|uniref:class I adenylate-forming enzyme family protein n=1 Tax=Armatimonas sp. TaxID=1872638 RepID=UPI00286B4B17|nr:class I adenylate-forming enzyme family protein [Armatimonas sp.]